MDARPPGRADAATPVPMPLGEVFALANNADQAGRTDEADRLLTHLRAAAPEQPDVLQLAGVVAFRKGRHAEALDRARRRHRDVSAQRLRGLSRARALRRGARGCPARRAAGAVRPALPA